MRAPARSAGCRKKRVSAASMPSRAVFALTILNACGYDAKSPWSFRGRTEPVDIVMTGSLAPGTRVKLGTVDLEVLDVEDSRTDDELVSASLRGAFADLALGAAVVSATAKAGATSAEAAAQNMQVTSAEAARTARKLESKADDVSDVAGRVAKFAAIAAVIGS
ncbi:MAG TPA: hypothetical protein VM925_07865, partial [Labilithrix sp.]|nr:hypothetical protein [Labilithrix sp.]